MYFTITINILYLPYTLSVYGIYRNLLSSLLVGNSIKAHQNAYIHSDLHQTANRQYYTISIHCAVHCYVIILSGFLPTNIIFHIALRVLAALISVFRLSSFLAFGLSVCFSKYYLYSYDLFIHIRKSIRSEEFCVSCRKAANV